VGCGCAPPQVAHVHLQMEKVACPRFEKSFFERERMFMNNMERNQDHLALGEKVWVGLSLFSLLK
jgi:hypothetical protein